jgi:GTP-binding protein HflX
MGEKPLSNKTILVGVDLDDPKASWSCLDSLEELKDLADTAGLETVEIVSQARTSVHPKHYVGKGKVDELKTLVEEHCAGVLIADDELSPVQHKHLEAELNIKVLDRTSLILDIFSQRAQTYEAQLQIELAQLEYLLPRLTRLWTHLSRQAGGIGSRGPGETQLESDKRQIRKKITTLKKKLEKVQQHRVTQRKTRADLPIISVALVGYTNAGKSTLMNRLTKANVLAEDKLFATLDPTSRHFQLDEGDHIVITDTVGFIQKLPHHLVNAFYSTLEEVTHADIILHVIDASHPNLDGILNTSSEIIESLHAKETPMLYVFNKWDGVKKPNTTLATLKEYSPQICISVLKDPDITPLLSHLQDMINSYKEEMTLRIPYNRMDIMNLLHKYGNVKDTQYDSDILVTVHINRIIGEKLMNQLHSGSSEEAS